MRVLRAAPFLLAAAVAAGSAHAVDIAKVEAGLVRVFSKNQDKRRAGTTGFAINANGMVLVANHGVFADATELVVIKAGADPGKPANRLKATVVVRDTALNLMVLKVAGLKARPLALANGEPAKGARVYAIGFPRKADSYGGLTEATVTAGVVSRVVAGRKGFRIDARVVQHGALIAPGMSGAPLVDACDRVVGLNAYSTIVSLPVRGSGGNRPRAMGMATSFYFAISSKALVKMLTEKKIRFVAAPRAAGGRCPPLR